MHRHRDSTTEPVAQTRSSRRLRHVPSGPENKNQSCMGTYWNNDEMTLESGTAETHVTIPDMRVALCIQQFIRSRLYPIALQLMLRNNSFI
ncbi:hypothetical protein PUN28_010990 [Cardiocondyla obscurior]|uniref:Uncharacterized protein n=1 Tax=Cardiocondyla obscurior TaxID=286306 RepID=A0AAW2FPF5_9HYME